MVYDSKNKIRTKHFLSWRYWDFWLQVEIATPGKFPGPSDSYEANNSPDDENWPNFKPLFYVIKFVSWLFFCWVKLFDHHPRTLFVDSRCGPPCHSLVALSRKIEQKRSNKKSSKSATCSEISNPDGIFDRTYNYRANDGQNHEDLKVDLKLVVLSGSFDIKKNGDYSIDSRRVSYKVLIKHLEVSLN